MPWDSGPSAPRRLTAGGAALLTCRPASGAETRNRNAHPHRKGDEAPAQGGLVAVVWQNDVQRHRIRCRAAITPTRTKDTMPKKATRQARLNFRLPPELKDVI